MEFIDWFGFDLMREIYCVDDLNDVFMLSSRRGILSVVRELLRNDRVDPSDHHNYVIRWASINGYIEVVKLLLADERVDPSDYDNYAISWTSSRIILRPILKAAVRNWTNSPKTKAHTGPRFVIRFD